jgi:DNA-binding transcriptional MerR regulator
MTMLTPAQLAGLTGVSPDTLRHYERKGLLRPQRTSSGYRRYPPESVDRVHIIRRALIVGFSLKELAQFFAERERGGVPCHSVRSFVEKHLAELELRLLELRRLKKDLQAMLREWDATLAVTPPGKQARLLDQLAKPDTLVEGFKRHERFPDLTTPLKRTSRKRTEGE